METVILAGLTIMRWAIMVYGGGVVWNLFVAEDKRKSFLGLKHFLWVLIFYALVEWYAQENYL